MQFDRREGPKKVNLGLNVSRSYKTREIVSVVGMNKGLDFIGKQESKHSEEDHQVLDENERQRLATICNVGRSFRRRLAMQQNDVSTRESKRNHTHQEMDDGKATQRPRAHGGRSENPSNSVVTKDRNDREEVEDDESSPKAHVAGNNDVASESGTQRNEEDDRTNKPDHRFVRRYHRRSSNRLSEVHDGGDDYEVSSKHVDHTKKPNEVTMKDDGNQLSELHLQRVRDETKQNETGDDLNGSEEERDKSQAVTKVRSSNGKGRDVMTSKE